MTATGPMADEKTRTLVKVLGWLALVLGSLYALGGLFDLKVLLFGGPPATVRTPPLAGVLVGFGAACAPLHVWAAVCGYGLTRRRRWAGGGLEVLNWVGLFLCVAIVVWVLGFADLSGLFQAPAHPNPRFNVQAFQRAMAVFFRVVAVGAGVLTMAVAGVLIWFLRRPATRACLED